MVGARELLHDAAGARDPDRPRLQLAAAFVRRSLEIVGFEDHFDVVVSGHEVAAPKPAPDPYLEACRRLGVEAGPEVVALEDSPTGVAAARAAGLTVIGIPSIEGVALRKRTTSPSLSSTTSFLASWPSSRRSSNELTGPIPISRGNVASRMGHSGRSPNPTHGGGGCRRHQEALWAMGRGN